MDERALSPQEPELVQLNSRVDPRVVDHLKILAVGREQTLGDFVHCALIDVVLANKEELRASMEAKIAQIAQQDPATVDRDIAAGRRYLDQRASRRSKHSRQ